MILYLGEVVHCLELQHGYSSVGCCCCFYRKSKLSPSRRGTASGEDPYPGTASMSLISADERGAVNSALSQS